jgi:hypothetical protein
MSQGAKSTTIGLKLGSPLPHVEKHLLDGILGIDRAECVQGPGVEPRGIAVIQLDERGHVTAGQPCGGDLVGCVVTHEPKSVASGA